MDGGSVPPPSYHQPTACYPSAPPIPQDIFQPLLVIAQLQYYNADEVSQYYRLLLQHLRRLGTQNTVAAYAPDQKVRVSITPEPPVVSIAAGVYGDHVSPKTIPTIEESTFQPSYEVGQDDQLNLAPSPRQQFPELEKEVTPPAPSPAASFHAEYQQPAFSTPTPSPAPQFAPQPYQHSQPQSYEHNQWLQIPFTTQPYEQPHYAQHNPYYTTTHPQYLQQFSPPQMYQPETTHDSSSLSLWSSLGRELCTPHGLFPLIDVVPARARGRGIRKGVRKVITRGVMGVAA